MSLLPLTPAALVLALAAPPPLAAPTPLPPAGLILRSMELGEPTGDRLRDLSELGLMPEDSEGPAASDIGLGAAMMFTAACCCWTAANFKKGKRYCGPAAAAKRVVVDVGVPEVETVKGMPTGGGGGSVTGAVVMIVGDVCAGGGG